MTFGARLQPHSKCLLIFDAAPQIFFGDHHIRWCSLIDRKAHRLPAAAIPGVGIPSPCACAKGSRGRVHFAMDPFDITRLETLIDRRNALRGAAGLAATVLGAALSGSVAHASAATFPVSIDATQLMYRYFVIPGVTASWSIPGPFRRSTSHRASTRSRLHRDITPTSRSP
jgi:hypothetical protein